MGQGTTKARGIRGNGIMDFLEVIKAFLTSAGIVLLLVLLYLAVVPRKRW